MKPTIRQDYLDAMVGPKVPKQYIESGVSDGCTCAPSHLDIFRKYMWTEACVVHDYEYYHLRKEWAYSYKRATKTLKSYYKRRWVAHRRQADYDLFNNIITCTNYISIRGELVERPLISRIVGNSIAFVYFAGVRLLGWMYAK